MSNSKIKAGISIVVCLLAASVATPQDDRYFGFYDGTWDSSNSWEGEIVPSPGDNAFLVRPYFFNVPAVQPLFVFFHSATDPELDRLVIESSNWLIQSDDPGFDVLSSNFEVIGGYDGILEGVVEQVDHPLWRSRHRQDGGTNTITNTLTMGGIAGSGGLYDLRGGVLTTGGTIVGDYGLGEVIQAGGEHSVQNLLTLGAAETASGTYELNGGQLSTAVTVVAVNGMGEFNHRLGNHGANGLSVGFASGATGNYNLSGGELSVVGTTTVGREGLGTFTQTGGDHTANKLIVAETVQQLAGEISGYTLSNGNLNVATDSVIGDQGWGTFDQTGGIHNTNNLIVAAQELSVGIYTLSGALSELNVASEFLIAETAGRFIQDGGTVKVGSAESSGQFHMNAGGFDLNGGFLNVIGDSEIANGTFTQNAGEFQTLIHTVGGVHEMGGGTFGVNELNVDRRMTQTGGDARVAVGLVIGKNSAPLASEYNLEGGEGSDRTLLTVNGLVTIGQENEALFRQNGEYQGAEEWSSKAVFQNLTLGEGSRGDYELEGGELTVSGLAKIGNQSEAVFTQRGENVVSGEVWTSSAVFNDLHVGVDGSGAYVLEGGEIRVDGEAIIGKNAFGSLTQSRGSYVELVDLVVGDEGTGRYELGDGSLDVKGNVTIGRLGVGSIAQGTTVVNIDGNLLLGEAFFIDPNTGAAKFGRGSYEIDRGALLVNGNVIVGNYNTSEGLGSYFALRSSGSEIDHDLTIGRSSLFSMSTTGLGNSSLTVFGKTDVYGTMRLTGDSTATFWGGVDGYGKILVNNSEVDFGDLLLRGELTTDPSSLYFNNLTITETGAIQASEGDQFFVSGDFLNGSTENEVWDTDHASLIFNRDSLQSFLLAGADLGTTRAGYQNNFAWGELIVQSGSELFLDDGNLEAGAALYVGAFVIEDGVDLNSMTIDSISGEFNIYYDPLRVENSYLQGLAYQFNGSGFLIPTAIPEPGHGGVLLLLLTFGYWHRRRRG